MLVRFSKYDFWIPEQILDFNKFFPDKNFRKTRRFFFRDPKKFEKNPMKKSMKNENFKISIFSKNFRNFEIFIFHWLFRRFFLRFFFGLEKYFFDFFEKMFWSRNFLFLCRFFSISIGNFLRNPKIILRKSCDHLKYTKT